MGHTGAGPVASAAQSCHAQWEGGLDNSAQVQADRQRNRRRACVTDRSRCPLFHCCAAATSPGACICRGSSRAHKQRVEVGPPGAAHKPGTVSRPHLSRPLSDVILLPYSLSSRSSVSNSKPFVSHSWLNARLIERREG